MIPENGDLVERTHHNPLAIWLVPHPRMAG